MSWIASLAISELLIAPSRTSNRSSLLVESMVTEISPDSANEYSTQVLLSATRTLPSVAAGRNSNPSPLLSTVIIDPDAPESRSAVPPANVAISSARATFSMYSFQMFFSLQPHVKRIGCRVVIYTSRVRVALKSVMQI